MKFRLRLALSVFATLSGVFVLLLYTTLVQDVFFKGVTFCNASQLQLILKAVALGGAGILTGFLTALLVLQDNYYPNVLLSVAVLGKLFFAVGCQGHFIPFWYDLVLGSALLSGLWAGYYSGVKFPLVPASST